MGGVKYLPLDKVHTGTKNVFKRKRAVWLRFSFLCLEMCFIKAKFYKLSELSEPSDIEIPSIIML